MSSAATGQVFTLLGKPDCHLCHAMRKVAARVLERHGATLVFQDVREDPETERQYRLDIPVLLLGKQEIARHRVSEAELLRRLESL